VTSTPSIQGTQGTIRSLVESSPDEHVSLITARSIINFPTPFIEAEAGAVRVALHRATDLEVKTAVVRVVFLGRFDDITVRAWTFTLDGHDFYVLRLNETETLIYDTSTEQWVNWDSHGLPVWRVRCGINWIDGQSLGDTYGSNIVAGDDQKGILWVLDPEQSYDDAVLEDAPVQEVTFPRIVMGQIPSNSRNALPCYVVSLIGDNYGPMTAAFTPQITLEFSDDAGKTYYDAGTISVTPLTVDQRYEWYSLGQIVAPGRLFRLRDTGVFTRIDSLTMNDAGDD
jgi:hypothetical protein